MMDINFIILTFTIDGKYENGVVSVSWVENWKITKMLSRLDTRKYLHPNFSNKREDCKK